MQRITVEPVFKSRTNTKFRVLTGTGNIDSEIYKGSLANALKIKDAFLATGEYTDTSELKEWTVTIAGSERHEGHKPYTYVVLADNASKAWKKVRDAFVKEQFTDDETPDVVKVEVKPGNPGPDANFHWNDARA